MSKTLSKTLLVSLGALILSLGGTAIAKQNGALTSEKAVGSWAGSWSGGSSGKFELTITKEADGKLSATMTVMPEQGDSSTVKAKSLEVADNKLKLKLEDPDGNVEITLEGSLDGEGLKGSYSVREKAQNNEVETGNWTASKSKK